MVFIDANIFLRHLTRDIPRQSDACYALFNRLEVGALEATTSEAVIAEVVYVLSSRHLYAMSRSEIVERMRSLLVLRGLRLPHRKTYFRALELYAAHRIDFEDALSIAHMERQGIAEIYSYDRDFDAIRGVRRIEPDLP